MTLKNLLTLFVLSALALTATPQTYDGIRVGTDELKYLVYIEVYFTDGFIHCGGVVVSDQWILSAGHNFENRKFAENRMLNEPNQIKIVAGVKNRQQKKWPTQIRVVDPSAVIIHDEYLYNNDKKYDVALVFLNRRLNIRGRTSGVRPAVLARHGDVVQPDTEVTVAGWGCTRRSDWPVVAYKAHPKILSEDYCDEHATFYHRDHNLCYGCQQGTCGNAGKGDSGTPVVELRGNSEVVIGIHVAGCNNLQEVCTPEHPGTAIDIAKVRNWIDTKMGVRRSTFFTIEKLVGTFLAAAAASGAFAFYLNYAGC